MSHVDLDPALARRLECWSAAMGVVVVAIGVAGLAGWLLGVPMLVSVAPDWATIKPNSAFSLLLVGFVLLLGARVRRPAHTQLVGRGAALVVALLGLLTLAEHIFAVDLGIDRWLLDVPDDPATHAPPGRPPQVSAVGLLCLGAALALLDVHRAGRLRALVAGIALAIGLVVVLAYCFGAGDRLRVDARWSMAFSTACGFIVAGIGVILARPLDRPALLLTSTTSGGSFARRLLPFALVAPPLVGALHSMIGQAPLFGPLHSGATIATLYTGLLALLVWRSALHLRRADLRRNEIERTVGQEHALLQGIIATATDAIVVCDSEQRVVLMNPAAEAMFGHRSVTVVGQPLDVLLPVDAREAHLRSVRRFGTRHRGQRKMGAARPVEGLRADGSTFPVETAIATLDVQQRRFYTAILREMARRQDDEPPGSFGGQAPGMAASGAAGLGQEARAPVDDRLDAPELEAGRLQAGTQDFHLPSMLEEACEAVADAVRGKGVAIDLEYGRLPPWVQSDPARLRQALRNCLGNAARVTKRGSIVVRARPAAADEADTLLVRFEMRDTGPGLTLTRRLARSMGGEAGIPLAYDDPANRAGQPAAAAPGRRGVGLNESWGDVALLAGHSFAEGHTVVEFRWADYGLQMHVTFRDIRNPSVRRDVAITRSHVTGTLRYGEPNGSVRGHGHVNRDGSIRFSDASQETDLQGAGIVYRCTAGDFVRQRYVVRDGEVRFEPEVRYRRMSRRSPVT